MPGIVVVRGRRGDGVPGAAVEDPDAAVGLVEGGVREGVGVDGAGVEEKPITEGEFLGIAGVVI